MLSPSTFLNLAKSLNVSSFSKMQDTKHSIFTENIDYIHKSFLIAHPPLGQRVGEEFEGLLIMPMLLEKEIGKCVSFHAFRHIAEAVAESEVDIFTPFKTQSVTMPCTVLMFLFYIFFLFHQFNGSNVLRSNVLTRKSR